MVNTEKQFDKSTIKDIRDRISVIKAELGQEFVERDEEIHGLTLAILSDANILFLGLPGVGKSRLVRFWQKHIKNADYFSYLLSQFTVPEELTGPASLSKLQEDRYVKNTEGMLPEAHLAFIDEVWKGNSGVLNFLLPILNERVFFNDGEPQKIPLLTLAAASNELPEEQDHLDAAVDRFVLKYQVKGVTEQKNYIKMMRGFLNYDEDRPLTKVTVDEIHNVRDYIYNMPVDDGILTTIHKIITKLEKENIYVSARVANQSLRIVQANAFLNGNEKVTELDLDILKHVYWDQPEDKNKVQSIILKETNPAEEQLYQLLSRAEEIFDDVKDLRFVDSEEVEEDENQIAARAIAAVNKLKTTANKMDRIRTDMAEKGRDTEKAKKMLRKVIGYGKEISNNTISADYSQLDNI